MEEILKKLITEAIEEALKANTKTVDVIEIMTRDQLAGYLQVSVSWVNKNIKDLPRLEGVGGTRFRKKDIDEWLDSKLETSADAKVNIRSSKKCTYKVV